MKNLKGLISIPSQYLPWHVGYGFEFVVDEELGGHHDKPKHIHKAGEGGEDERVPPLVLLVEEGIDGIANHLQNNSRKQQKNETQIP